MDANVEISSLLLPHLDRHLALPILEFLEEQNVYPKDELLAAKYELLKPTNMIHFVESTRKELENDQSEGLSSEMEKKAQEILQKRDELKQKADKVIEIISNPQVATALGQDKERNLATLREKYNVSGGRRCWNLGAFVAACSSKNGQGHAPRRDQPTAHGSAASLCLCDCPCARRVSRMQTRC